MILGYDAAGVVEPVGPQVNSLSIGDEVWYAGDITRPGSNAEFQAVDERIVARKPASLSFADAAAMPLTTITAWESLFDRFGLTAESTGEPSGARRGGRRRLGDDPAGEGADRRAGDRHRQPRRLSRMGDESRCRRRGRPSPVARGDTRRGARWRRLPVLAALRRQHRRLRGDREPFGHITAIDEPPGLDLVGLKAKSIAWHWELMFTRAMYETPDMIEQQRLLDATADLVDRGVLRTTVTRTIEDFSSAGLKEAHRAVESGRMIGKIVVTR